MIQADQATLCETVSLENMPVARARPQPYRSSLLAVVTAVGVFVLAGCASLRDQPPPTSAVEVCGAELPNSDPTVKPPVLVHTVELILNPFDLFPAFACLEGTVTTDGTLTDVKVMRASSPYMSKSAVDAVRDWRYLPATRDDSPIDYPIRIPLFIDAGNE